MKKIVGILKHIVHSKPFAVVALVLIGAALGVVVGYGLWGHDSSINTSSYNAAQLSKKELAERRKEQSQERYNQAKQMIANGVKQKRITQAEANKILAKIEQVKVGIDSSDPTTREGREELRKKREALRKWAQENDVPLAYIMMVY